MLQAGVWAHLAMAAAAVLCAALCPQQSWSIASVYMEMASVCSGAVMDPASMPAVVRWLPYISFTK